MLYAQVHLTLPAWVHDAVDTARTYPGDDEKIALAIQLSRLNVDAQTGGPFGAAVFGPSDRLIAVGVNRVLPQSTSVAHAETMAGIDRLLIGARAEDVMALTEFDEGPLPADWVGELNARGIEVVRDLHRHAACEVLRAYGERGGDVY